MATGDATETLAAAPTAAAGASGRLEARGDGVVAVVGDWSTAALSDVEQNLRSFGRSAGAPSAFDLGGLEKIDVNGVLLLRRAAASLGADENIRLIDARPEHSQLIDVVAEASKAPPFAEPSGTAIGRILDHLGRSAVDALSEGVELLSFIGASTITIISLIVRPWRIRWRALVTQIEATGLDALPIVGLLNFLIGVVIAYQAANQLSKFGAELLTVDSVGVGVLRELGVLITAIIVAGRSGSAFTAQIGSMRVNQEVDAMQALGLNPLEVLCAPRIVALIIVLPLLTFYADVMGILGGAVAAMFALDITLTQFAKQLQAAVSINHFWVGMVKAPVMAAVIAAIGCFHGLKVSSNAESVGRRTTQSVVQAVFFVIAIDAVFSVFFLIIGV